MRIRELIESRMERNRRIDKRREKAEKQRDQQNEDGHTLVLTESAFGEAWSPFSSLSVDFSVFNTTRLR